MTIIGKKEVEHLAELARIEIADVETEKLAGDLEKILKHFEELKEVDTGGVRPMDGGTFEENVFRADGATSEMGNVKSEMNTRKKIVEQFPEEKDGFLKVPPVFDSANYEL